MDSLFKDMLTIATDRGELSRVRGFIREQAEKAGLDQETAQDLAFAVDEACTNIIHHGHEGMMQGEIAVSFHAESGEVHITIVDQGRSFDPESLTGPDLDADWEDRQAGGLGWHLIQEIADSVHYLPDENKGNRLTLILYKDGTEPI